MALTRTPLLEDRIKAIRAEIDELIGAHVEQVAKECPGVPAEMIRRTIVGADLGCQCSAYNALKAKGTL